MPQPRNLTFGRLFAEWPLVDLAHVAFYQEGPGLRSWQWTTDGMKVINGKNVLVDGTIDLTNTERYISLEEFESRYSHFAIEADDIVVVSSGSIGKVGRIRSSHLPLMMNTSVIRFHPHDQTVLDPEFLFAFLRSDQFQNQAASFAIGAAQLNFGPAHIQQMKIPLPPIEIQRTIGRIVSAYDQLIENNLRRLEIIEEMARAKYSEWFVKFRFPGHETIDIEHGAIPTEWTVQTLGNILRILESGSRPPGGIDPSERDVPSVGAENIRGLGRYDYSKEKYVNRAFFDAMRRGRVESGDVLLYKDGAYIGRTALFRDYFPHEELAINEHVFRLRSDPEIPQSFLYFCLSHPDTTQRLRDLNSNAAQPGISQQKLRSLELVIPQKHLIELFDQWVEPRLQLLFNLARQIVLLRRTRDVLLPRIISGEIDVSDLDIDTSWVAA